jgi:hypothetical protein
LTTLTTDSVTRITKVGPFRVNNPKPNNSYFSKHGVNPSSNQDKISNQVTWIPFNLFLVKWVHKWQIWVIFSDNFSSNSPSSSSNNNAILLLKYLVICSVDRTTQCQVHSDPVVLELKLFSLLTLQKILDHSMGSMIISLMKFLGICKNKLREGSLDLRINKV